jgi:RNA polymerase sigma-70 factor (ECF subfamily)
VTPRGGTEARPAPASDEDLVTRCRAELPYQTGAFETLVRRYEGRVFGTCRRLLGDTHDAEEVTQDVFLAVYWTVGDFRGDCTFSTWLYGIARNKCISRHRAVARQERRHAEYAAGVAGDMASLPTSSPEAQIGVGPVAEAFHRLAPADRRVLHLRHLDQLPLRQLASVCGVTLSAAKMRLYRAEQRFRDLYQSSQATPQM